MSIFSYFLKAVPFLFQRVNNRHGRFNLLFVVRTHVPVIVMQSSRLCRLDVELILAKLFIFRYHLLIQTDFEPMRRSPDLLPLKGSPFTTWVLLRINGFWRRVWDLNPGNLSVCRFSRAVPSTTRPTLHIKLLFAESENFVETDAKLTPL